jgi:hypothetical protein
MVQRGRVERQRVRRQREMPNGGAGDLDLRILQLCIGNLRGQPMKNLAGKRRRRQALRRVREVTHPICALRILITGRYWLYVVVSRFSVKWRGDVPL